MTFEEQLEIRIIQQKIGHRMAHLDGCLEINKIVQSKEPRMSKLTKLMNMKLGAIESQGLILGNTDGTFGFRQHHIDDIREEIQKLENVLDRLQAKHN